MNNRRVGEFIATLGEVRLPSGARYQINRVRTGNGEAAQLAFIALSGNRREIVIFSSAVGKVAWLLTQFAEDHRR